MNDAQTGHSVIPRIACLGRPRYGLLPTGVFTGGESFGPPSKKEALQACRIEFRIPPPEKRERLGPPEVNSEKSSRACALGAGNLRRLAVGPGEIGRAHV